VAAYLLQTYAGRALKVNSTRLVSRILGDWGQAAFVETSLFVHQPGLVLEGAVDVQHSQVKRICRTLAWGHFRWLLFGYAVPHLSITSMPFPEQCGFCADKVSYQCGATVAEHFVMLRISSQLELVQSLAVPLYSNL